MWVVGVVGVCLSGVYLIFQVGFSNPIGGVTTVGGVAAIVDLGVATPVELGVAVATAVLGVAVAVEGVFTPRWVGVSTSLHVG